MFFFFVIFLGLALFGYVLIALWRSTPDDSYARFDPRSYRRYRDHAACGACGYPAKGLGSFQCPECGADLREVGITTPQALRRVGPVGKVVFWTIGLAIIAWIATEGFIKPVMPQVETVSIRRSFQRPSSGEYVGISLHAEGQRLLWRGEAREPNVWGVGAFRQLALRLEHHAPPESVLDVDLIQNRATAVRRRNQAGSAVIDLTPQSLLAWMQSEGIDTTQPGVALEVNTILKAIDRIASGDEQMPPSTPAFAFSPGGVSRNSGRRFEGADPYILAGWIVIWLVTTVSIVRQERRGVVSTA